MVDTVDGTVYEVEGGYFVDPSGKQLLPGWRSSVGVDNYERLFTDDDVRGPFVRVFVWTVLFALLSVMTTFALGLGLAMVFNNARMKGRRIYRSLIIIPYALPSFMTALVWRGMFNQSFGVINRWLGINAAWLDGQWLPYVSILIVNLWLGYPYMWLVCTGALQSIPTDLNEAAFVDGATGVTAFRRITFPLLMTAVAPLLIASFAFNFNNFNIIYLLTEGKPPISGSDAGRTDILISYTYKLAFAGGRGADYGFASAVSLIIFILVAAISAFSFRLHEDVRGGPLMARTETRSGTHRNLARWFFDTGWRHLFAIGAVLFAIFPLLWVVSAAFSSGSLSSQTLIPRRRRSTTSAS
jgi:ABC-type sugar transport system permease subunit